MVSFRQEGKNHFGNFNYDRLSYFSTMVYPNRISLIALEKGMTQADLSRATGLALPIINRFWHGERRLNQDITKKLCKAFNCSTGELFDDSEKLKIKVEGRVGASSEVFIYDIDDDHDDCVTIPFGLNPKDLAVVRVDGNSQYPAYPDKTLLYYYRRNAGVDPQALKQMSVGETMEHLSFFKFLKPGKKTGYFDLISINAPPIEEIKLRWASKVVAAIFP